jgi:hypothetical protein
VGLDFYLSEMSASDLHGGGLTLRRILGADLEAIPLFLHVSRFGQDVPPVQDLRARCIDSPMWAESTAARRWLGFRAARWIANRTMFMRQHARRSVDKMLAQRAAASTMSSNDVLQGLVCPQGAASLWTLEQLKARGPVRYITWIMDDHLVRFRGRRWHYSRPVRDVMRRHLTGAHTVFVISQTLAAFYAEEFGVQSQVLFGPADFEREDLARAGAPTSPLTIGYFGSVGPWQLDALVRFASAIPEGEAWLDIFTHARTLPAELTRPSVRILGAVSASAVRDRMRAYDAVLLPISFASSQRHLSEFNIATKMSECLASGAVTIVCGPEYAAMVRLLKGTGAAYIETNPSSGSWQALAAKLRDERSRVSTLTAAREFVNTTSSVAVMREKWDRALANLARADSEPTSGVGHHPVTTV